jgi:hypothetical protein
VVDATDTNLPCGRSDGGDDLDDDLETGESYKPSLETLPENFRMFLSNALESKKIRILELLSNTDYAQAKIDVATGRRVEYFVPDLGRSLIVEKDFERKFDNESKKTFG